MLRSVFCLFLFCFALTSFAEDFVPGKDYIILNGSLKNRPVKQEVTEFFSYGCPWCFKLEDGLTKWISKHQSTITFKRVPVAFNKDWETYAKAFYTAQALSLETKLTPELFNAILVEKHSLSTNKSMIEFFTSKGVDPQIAQSAFTNSPTIELNLQNSKKEMAEFQVSAVPAFVINNQYKTDLQMAKTEERLFAILNFLVANSK
jgi:thiol:disulfide interchange protein DsbA